MQHSIPSQLGSNEQCLLASTGTSTTVLRPHTIKQYRKKPSSLVDKFTNECHMHGVKMSLNIFVYEK